MGMTSAPNIQPPKGPDSADEGASRWFMELEDVPETPLHAAIIQLLMLILGHRYPEPEALVTTNLGCRWDPDDARIGVDPDVVVIEPAPPKDISTLRVWLPNHPPPRLAIEVVSHNSPEKDYVEGPARLARLGAEELWIFDPKLYGPTLEALGGPYVLQIWRRPTEDAVDMRRIYAGDGPAYSPALKAWAIVTDGGERLRVAADASGDRLWPTGADTRRADKEAARADKEAARAEAAEAEIKRLRALLDKQQS